MKILIHSLILIVAMIACQWVALFYPPFWQPENAHDTLPRGANLAVFIFCLAVVLRGGFRWSILELLVCLFWAPFTALVSISVYLGETVLHAIGSFSLARLLTMSIFIFAPWLLGLLIGSLFLRFRARRSHDAA